MKQSFLFAIIVAVAALAPVTAAQVPQPPPARRLTLPMALDMAEQQNLELAAARLQRSVALAGTRIARQIPNPTVSTQVARDTPHEDLTVGIPLEIGGQRGRRLDVANAEVSVTESLIETVSRQIRRRVREAFYNLALARGVTERRESALALANRLRDIAQARFDSGDIPQLEVFQADLEVARAQTQIEVARTQELSAANELNVLLNEPADSVWDLGDVIEMLPPSVTLPDLIQRASASNPQLQTLLRELTAEEARHSLLRAERLPNLGVEAGVDFNAPPDFRRGARAALSLDVPVFSRNQGQLAQSEAQQRALLATIAAARLAVAGSVGAAYYEYAARQREVTLQRDTLLPAVQRIETLAEDSYREGRETILFVLSAQRDMQQIQLDYLQSLSTLQAAFAALEEIVGAPLD
jgi:outer membrane protein, heavy metal efflux system